MGLLEILCSLLNDVLSSLRSALPQLGPIWDALQSELDSLCGQNAE